jgi:hypothetical protein
MKKVMFFVIAIMTMCITAKAGDAKGNGVLKGKEFGKHTQDNELQQFLLHYTEGEYQKKYKKILAFDVTSAGDAYKQLLSEIFPDDSFEEVLSGTEEGGMPTNLSNMYQVGYIPLNTNSFDWFSRAARLGEKGLFYKGIYWASTYCWNPLLKKTKPSLVVDSAKPGVKKDTTKTVVVTGSGTGGGISISNYNYNYNNNTGSSAGTTYPGSLTSGTLQSVLPNSVALYPSTYYVSGGNYIERYYEPQRSCWLERFIDQTLWYSRRAACNDTRSYNTYQGNNSYGGNHLQYQNTGGGAYHGSTKGQNNPPISNGAGPHRGSSRG